MMADILEGRWLPVLHHNNNRSNSRGVLRIPLLQPHATSHGSDCDEKPRRRLTRCVAPILPVLVSGE
ncbi:hypothetical protein RRG08_026349 [Elysia crispata]|uniref:Uncharacterized protein n=1 Tax=Elysia crispata TaxID=231223 RepID=A0AAE0XN22_9GAST|nr:hypothetical protein RRG08_026349 [Elysia crispata]